MATLDTLRLPMAASQPRLQQSPPPPVTAQAAAALPVPNTVRVTGGNGAPRPVSTVPSTSFPTSTVGSTAAGAYNALGDEASILNSYLSQFTNADSALMRQARTAGIEQAAARGLQNSSIAAGAAQRAALDYAAPLALEAMGTFNQRENRNWQTNERTDTQQWQSNEDRAQREWTAGQNQLDRDQQITMSQVQNWLNNEAFQRDFNAQLSLFPIQNTTQLLNTIMQQAATNPEVWTPDVISGMSEFFTTNFLDILARYFPSMYENVGGA